MPDISRGTFGDCRVNSRWIPLLGPNTDVVYLIYAAVLTLWRHQLQSTSHQGTESVFSRCGQPHSRITQDGVVVMVVLLPAGYQFESPNVHSRLPEGILEQDALTPTCFLITCICI